MEAHPRVLIADDDEDSAELLAEALDDAGFETWIAHDGPEALAAAAEEAPAAAVVDIELPGLDGYQLADRLRHLPGGDRMVLIALTGHSEDSFRARSRSAGFSAHLVKPIELSEILPLLPHP